MFCNGMGDIESLIISYEKAGRGKYWFLLCYHTLCKAVFDI